MNGPNQIKKLSTCSRKRRDGETERVHAAVLEQEYIRCWLVGDAAIRANETRQRHVNGPRTPASQCPRPNRRNAPRERGARGTARARHGEGEGKAEAAKRPACRPPSSPHTHTPLPLYYSSVLPMEPTQPKPRASRDSAPPTCRPRPRAVAHVPRRALPRAPPSARVRLAAPPFLSHRTGGPNAPCSLAPSTRVIESTDPRRP
jgi:hypothetical protein